MDKNLAMSAIKMLDEEIGNAGLDLVKLTTGGGGSMVLAYNYPGKTNDVDAIPTTGSFDEIKTLAESVARKLNIDHDWLNPYFGAYTIYLPADANTRLTRIYSGENLIVDSLGIEDVLLMKLMAGRSKDLAHTRYLLKMEPNLKIVENRLEAMKEKGLYADQVADALDLLDELTSE